MTTDTPKIDNSYLAEALFRQELPKIVEANPEKVGTWVLFSKDGCLEEASSEQALYQKYGDRNVDDNYFIGRILPQPPETDIDVSWCSMVEPKITKARTR